MLSLLVFLLTSCAVRVEKTIAQEQPVQPEIPDAQLNEMGLADAASSIDELCKEVLERVAQEDIKSLEAMALTEDEFRRFYWPYSEWSRPEVRMPFEYYWGDLHQRSSSALKGVLARHGGKKLEFISVRFSKEAMQYQDAKVHRHPKLTVKDEEGQQQELEIFGSIFELNGNYKIFSYRYK